MRPRAVIDTNVLVSAMLKSESIPGAILSLVFNRAIVPLFNRPILDEYRQVLLRPKFPFTAAIVDDVVGGLEGLGEFTEAPHLNIELPDPNDAVFLDVVVEARRAGEAFLVTGNVRHFPDEPFVLTPRQMYELLVGKSAALPPD